jgi:adenylate cyclase
MADVFLSYARPSEDAAKRAATVLRAAGFSVWYDEHLPAHRAYSEVIEEQLEGAVSVLVLWSQDAVRSQWVRSEANRARESGRLVQARLDDARLPMPFDQIQCADLRGWSGGRAAPGWQSVTSALTVLTDREHGEESGASNRTGASSRWTRRQVLGSGGALATAAAAALGVAWLRNGEPDVSPEAQSAITAEQGP